MNKAVIAALTALTVSGAAQAENYLTGSVGRSSATIDCSGTISCDTRDTGFKLTGGVGLTSTISAEATYFNFGKVRIVEDMPPVISGHFSADGVGLGLAHRSTFTNKLHGIVRVGVVALAAKITVPLGGGVTASQSDTKVKPYLGVGLGYQLGSQLALEGAADFSKAQFQGETVNLRLFTLGLSYRF